MYERWPHRVSGHMIPLYGGVSKLHRSPCILSTRSIKAVTQTIKFDKSGIYPDILLKLTQFSIFLQSYGMFGIKKINMFMLSHSCIENNHIGQLFKHVLIQVMCGIPHRIAIFVITLYSNHILFPKYIVLTLFYDSCDIFLSIISEYAFNINY